MIRSFSLRTWATPAFVARSELAGLGLGEDRGHRDSYGT